MKRFAQGVAVVIISVVLTTLAIDASDSLRGADGTMLAQLWSGANEPCPVGMTPVPGVTFSCVDRYEVSPGESCPRRQNLSVVHTSENTSVSECIPVSAADTEPWRFVSREAARMLCLRAGKRLPTAEEWYTAAIGTPDTTGVCNINSDTVSPTGASPECVSSVGVYDAVGNVWEWTSDEVIENVWNNRALPDDGFVTTVDSAGMAVRVAASADPTYGSDYLWRGDATVQAIMRGGFFGSGNDAGVYAVHTDVTAETAGQAIGFRCVL